VVKRGVFVRGPDELFGRAARRVQSPEEIVMSSTVKDLAPALVSVSCCRRRASARCEDQAPRPDESALEIVSATGEWIADGCGKIK
jgi:hypothetical protein